MKNIIVYGSTTEKAFNKLQELIDNMNQEDIKKVTKTSLNTGIFTIELKSGDCYKAVRASDNARGYRWQYAYIDKDISKELLDHVVTSKFIPEYGIDDYWNFDRNLEDYYEWY
ncbi:MAG: hypothetical protein PHX04_05920 [Bacilli bacterium]|nr:hypothetical protein [Bacilli bacterium]